MLSLVSLLSLAFFVECVPYFTPIQILRPSSDHHGLVATEQLASLLSAPGQMVLVSVVGPYHSGKSFLLNALAGKTDVFKVGPSTDPETKGVYVARTDRKTEDGKEIWLLDSEGFFGPQVPEEYDAKVFTISALLADKLVYNTVKVIDQNTVDRLELLLRRAALFNTKAAQQTAAEGLQRSMMMPELCWVVEDFVQSEAGGTAGAGAAGAVVGAPSGHSLEGWLREYLTEESYLRRNFESIPVHTLFLPATMKLQLRDLSTLSWDELTPEFRVEVARLRLGLFGSSKKVYTGETLVKMTHFLAGALNQGLFPELPSLWSHWQTQVREASVKDAVKLFDGLLVRNLDDVHPPKAKTEFSEELRRAEEKAFGFFVALVGNDTRIPSQLADQLHARATASGRIQTEKVDKYLAAQVREAIHEFRTAAGRIALPTEPQGLSQALARAKEDLVAEVEKLGTSLAGGGLVGGVVGELMSGVAAVATSTVEENNRKIALVLQTATQAAGVAVEEGILSLGERLLGAQEMRAFELELKEKSAKKFEEDTDKWKPWIRSLPVYHTTMQSVKAETQAKLTRFEAQHAVKVTDLFRKLADRVMAEYREARKELELRSLPAEELNLRERHQAIEAGLVERLNELAGNLADTESFRQTKTRLFESVRVEMQKLLRKNVELWKVHSDEATQCAVAMNIEHRKSQCLNGWICLFALWPPTHRAVTKANLNACFDKLQGSIPTSMRDSVFDSFYEKEMGREVTDVQRNLWITVVAVLAPVVWWTLLKINRP